jgi:hypothetical protein
LTAAVKSLAAHWEFAMNSKLGKNQTAFQEARRELGSRYPVGRFVAFDDGQIVADAASFDELTEALAAIGKDRPDVFVVQAGVDYPAETFILL